MIINVQAITVYEDFVFLVTIYIILMHIFIVAMTLSITTKSLM